MLIPPLVKGVQIRRILLYFFPNRVSLLSWHQKLARSSHLPKLSHRMQPFLYYLFIPVGLILCLVMGSFYIPSYTTEKRNTKVHILLKSERNKLTLTLVAED